MLDLTAMNRVLEVDLDKGTCTVEAGVSLDTLMRSLIPLGWFPMVVPGTRYVTVGGAIASDIHGKFRHGSFCDYVERFQLVTPVHGTIAVGRETHPDEFWSTAGGMGLTGIITEATLRLTAGRDRAADRRHRAGHRRRRLHGPHAEQRRALPLFRRVDRLHRARTPSRPVGAHARQPHDPCRAPRCAARGRTPVPTDQSRPGAADRARRAPEPTLDPGVQRDVVPQIAARPRRPHPDDDRLLPSARRGARLEPHLRAARVRAVSVRRALRCRSGGANDPRTAQQRRAALRSSRC